MKWAVVKRLEVKKVCVQICVFCRGFTTFLTFWSLNPDEALSIGKNALRGHDIPYSRKGASNYGPSERRDRMRCVVLSSRLITCLITPFSAQSPTSPSSVHIGKQQCTRSTLIQKDSLPLKMIDISPSSMVQMAIERRPFQQATDVVGIALVRVRAHTHTYAQKRLIAH